MRRWSRDLSELREPHSTPPARRRSAASLTVVFNGRDRDQGGITEQVHRRRSSRAESLHIASRRRSRLGALDCGAVYFRSKGRQTAGYWTSADDTPVPSRPARRPRTAAKTVPRSNSPDPSINFNGAGPG